MVVVLVLLVYIVVADLNIMLGKHVPGLVDRNDIRDIHAFVTLSIIPLINVIVLIGCLVFTLIQISKDYIRNDN